jgi:hypothetical protein
MGPSLKSVLFFFVYPTLGRWWMGNTSICPSKAKSKLVGGPLLLESSSKENHRGKGTTPHHQKIEI